MAKAPRRRRLQDLYAFPGFRPLATVHGVFGDREARLIKLVPRARKTCCGSCGTVHRTWYDRTQSRVRDLSSGGARVYLQLEVRRVRCRRYPAVKRERLEFLADNPLYTERFA